MFVCRMVAVLPVTSFRLPFVLLRACLLLGLCASLVYYVVVLEDSPRRPTGEPTDARALNAVANRRSGGGVHVTHVGTLGHHPPLHHQVPTEDVGTKAATMATTTRAMYSIWLEPPSGSPAAVKSAAFIKRQAARMPGSPPAFAPHVTLVGGFEGTEDEIRNKTLQLATDLGSETGPLFWGAECAVDDVGVGDIFFQCVYLLMRPTPQLMKAHELAAAAFGVTPGNGPGKPYMPHLSLVYGESFSPEEKEGAAAAARTELLVSGGGGSGGFGFTVDRLSLWRTDVSDRSCQSWELVDHFPLQG